MRFQANVAEHNKVNPLFWIQARVCCTPVYATSIPRIVKAVKVIPHAGNHAIDPRWTPKPRVLNLKSKRFENAQN